jgi:hypothetical protein
MEYEIVTQEVLLLVESVLQNAKQHAQIYLFFCLKMIGHGNPDNNLESCCIFLFNDAVSS